jgi:hypothetical protein
MKVWLIILAIYVALDILTGVGIYLALRINGWPPYEIGYRFRQVLKTPYHELVEDLAEELREVGNEDWDEDEVDEE